MHIVKLSKLSKFITHNSDYAYMVHKDLNLAQYADTLYIIRSWHFTKYMDTFEDFYTSQT